MEKAEISRLINSFNAIKGYFDTTKRYMPQIAKLVFFIEEIVPLLNTIHNSLHQTSTLIPSATEKLDKVTSATELAATEVMDIVDNVINRLNTMTGHLDEIEGTDGMNVDPALLKEKTTAIRAEIDGSQDDLFSIMNALQFQDITTQQINSIASTIDSVNVKLSELLTGFEDEGFDVSKLKDVAFDPNAEFDFNRSAESQKIADEFLKNAGKDADDDTEEIPEEDTGKQDNEAADFDFDGEITFGDDGQPDINSIMSQLNHEDNKKTE